MIVALLLWVIPLFSADDTTAASHIVIPIGVGAPGAGTYDGYVVSSAVYGNTLTLDTGDNSNTYELTQSGAIGFYSIVVSPDVETTITLSGINFTPSGDFIIQGGADVTLLLQGTNTFTKSIIVKEDATLTIDSATTSGSTDGELAVSLNNAQNACIGGSSTGHSGVVTIKGGTVTATQTGTSACAAIGGSGSPYTGTVVIEGGSVTASAVNGAAIGGGAGFSSMTPIRGYVTINGGTVTATSNGNGAAIGGGNQSTGKVVINGGNVKASCTLSVCGAAIGGGRGENGIGIVEIHGGDITATGKNGAAIGGGASESSSSPVPGAGEVTITGGTLRLKSDLGACIGNGGSAFSQLMGGGNGVRGHVTVTGGTIVGEFSAGNGIGTGKDYPYAPLVSISPQADILFYCNAVTNFPGIYCGEAASAKNEALPPGYFINGNFELQKGGSDGLLIVCEKDNPDVPVRVSEIPISFRVFSFTTGVSEPGDYYVYTGTISGGMKQIIRKTDNNPIIYSVIRPWEYLENSHVTGSYFRSLSVEFGDGILFPTLYYPVVERFVDINGDLIEDVHPNPSATPVAVGGNYGGTVLSTPGGYVYKGYKWDTWDGTYTSGTPAVTQINNGRTIYYVYDTAPDLAQVTVSKEVTGTYASKTILFDFSVLLSGGEPGGTLTFTGSVSGALAGVLAPASGTVTLDAGGDGVLDFSLCHGQAVTIEDMIVGMTIEVTEDTSPSSGYEVSILDSAYSSTTDDNTTGLVIIGESERTFAFLNTRIPVVPTGVDEGVGTSRWGWVLLGVLAAMTVGWAFTRRLAQTGLSR